MIFNDLQNMGMDSTIERSLYEANIEMFKDTKSNPTLNIYYNLMDAFPFTREGKRGSVTHLFTGTSLSGGLPSVIATNQSNNNTLTAQIFNKSIKLYNMGYDLRLDENLVQDGKLSPEKNIKEASKLLNFQAMHLMLNGEISFNNENMILVESSLYSCGTPTSGVNVNSTSTTVNIVNNMFLEMADGVENAGFTPEVLILSKKAYNKMLNLPKNNGEIGVFEFLKLALNIPVYITDFMDSVRGGGATAIMTTRDKAGLQGVIGHEAFLVHSGNTYIAEGQTRKYPLNVSVGGFIALTENNNVVQIRNKLLG